MHPFTYTHDAARARDFTQRLAAARTAPAAADPQGRMGIPMADLERLCRRLATFDWDGFASRLNEHPAFIHEYGGERLHFVHARSTDPGARALLLLHGWPGSFLEFRELIAPLTGGTPPFHVVCPSLPGYGFSTRSLEHPCDAAAIADILAGLMGALGYQRFLVQGGDWGSLIACELGRRHAARCLGLHLNMAPFLPPAEDDPVRRQVTAAEAAWLSEGARLWQDGMGYYAQQGTRPQTLAVALADSPRGLLAWLGEKHLAWSGRDERGASLVSDAAIADHVALYWMTDSIGSSMRLYYDERHARRAPARIEVPTGVAVFPGELIKCPRAWAAQRCQLVHWTVQSRGGHFAALEVPQLLLQDVRTFAAALGPGAGP
ncbi:MAG TPA: epoxide hydrolase [Steroidobacteraceae bacterium]|nr:epoxide hydrolase [Steroidobacteraceae bacterium]